MELGYPTSLFFLPEEYLVYDHTAHCIYVVAQSSSDAASPESLVGIKYKILELMNRPKKDVHDQNIHTDLSDRTLKALKTKKQYLKDIIKAQEYIIAGDSYEICLTLQFNAECNKDSLAIYSNLREKNSAPYSSYLKYSSYDFSSSPSSSSSSSSSSPSPSPFAVCCSSPERYLQVTPDSYVDSKPIKGTLRRSKVKNSEEDLKLVEKLSKDVKSRAENLMIVDLVRNDLGKVCELGTVSVPSLMSVESYATVHQLVSTIQGKLDPKKCISDVLKATFPGGSMTGAPKLRTMKIIEEVSFILFFNFFKSLLLIYNLLS